MLMCVFQSVAVCVCVQMHMLANRWNSRFPFNFNVKGMLQASGSMGLWFKEGAQITLYVCVRVCLCVCVCMYVGVCVNECMRVST